MNYKRLRNKYLPEKLRVIFILESPPASGKFFYNSTGRKSEPLFSAMMRLLDIKPSEKEKGLKEFARRGYFMVDTTYTPVNRRKGKKRDQVILDSVKSLQKDLRRILEKKKCVKIILIKAHICKILEPILLQAGFNVVNKGVIIPFPAFGHQREFHRRIKRLL